MQFDKAAASAWLGWASIACWFFAQVPQMIENVRLQSCEGLALPFLLNWLFGDLTNLVGCILTDQLPFQTYIAAYFCFVDIMLTAQFFYYRRKASLLVAKKRISSPKTPKRVRLRSQISTSFQSDVISPRDVRRSVSGKSEEEESGSAGVTLRPTIKRSRSSNQHLLANDLNALSEAAMDVAKAAERVHQRTESRRRRDESRNSSGRWLGNRGKRRRVDEGEDGEGGLGDSFLSEASGSTTTSIAQSPVLGTGTSRGRLPRRPELDEIVDEEAGDSEVTTRQSGLLSVSEEETTATGREKSRSQSHSVARGSRQRAAGLLFMGAFTMVGLMDRRGEIPWKRTAREGLISMPRGEVMVRSTMVETLDWAVSGSVDALHHPTAEKPSTYIWVDKREDNKHHRSRRHQQEIQHLIGRISAWICTTLYLTSRLPQIWKNYTRKSCEGLSVLLFIFAFFGNLTYVIGILINPAGAGDPTEAAHYLLESLPYLLGSGGTLIFDLTIMLQSYFYRSAIPSSHDEAIIVDPHTRRHRSHSRSHHASEEEPLIRQRSVSTDSVILQGMRYTGGRQEVEG